MKRLVLFGLVMYTTSAWSQNTVEFNELLKRAQVEFAVPLETFLKEIRVLKTDLVEYDYALKAKQDPVEIRYKIIPTDNNSSPIGSPQIKLTQIASTIASNEEESGDIVFHRMPDEELAMYNADYGVKTYLHPKSRFSDKKHCKIIFLFAENKGMVCTFLLFNKTDIDLSIYEKNLIFIKDI
ncbi:MAG: hypothetical protein KJP00_05150 [Bacteroidia bacterium]|nr:hypothetical protein [Bacteroidia bacterium]